jgi:hypothetical protein
MIRISSLPLVQSTEQFNLCTQILLVDVLYVGDAPRAMREYIKANHGGFVFDKKTYLPITLTGRPESLIANAEKGIHFKFDRGFENLYTLNGDLSYTIRRRKLYDLSDYAGQISFVPEIDFIIERYLAGNLEPEPITEHKPHLLTTPPLPSIGMKKMSGLKPV